MKSVNRPLRFLMTGASFGLFLTAAAGDEKEAAGVEAAPLLKTSLTVDGVPLAYPTGKPEVSSALITIQPGGHTSIHQHPVVTIVHVLEGEAELRVGEQVFHYKAGDVWVEPINVSNQLFNPGTVPLKNLVVFVGAEGTPNSVAAE